MNPEQNTTPQPTTPSPLPAPTNLTTSVTSAAAVPAANTKNHGLGIWLVAILLLSFLVPALGILTVPLIIYFAAKGTSKPKNGQPRTPAQKLLFFVGYICLALIAGFVGLVTLVFILFSTGNFKIG